MIWAELVYCCEARCATIPSDLLWAWGDMASPRFEHTLHASCATTHRICPVLASKGYGNARYISTFVAEHANIHLGGVLEVSPPLADLSRRGSICDGWHMALDPVSNPGLNRRLEAGRLGTIFRYGTDERARYAKVRYDIP
jgi:hypothetical protein